MAFAPYGFAPKRHRPAEYRSDFLIVADLPVAQPDDVHGRNACFITEIPESAEIGVGCDIRPACDVPVPSSDTIVVEKVFVLRSPACRT